MGCGLLVRSSERLAQPPVCVFVKSARRVADNQVRARLGKVTQGVVQGKPSCLRRAAMAQVPLDLGKSSRCYAVGVSTARAS